MRSLLLHGILILICLTSSQAFGEVTATSEEKPENVKKMDALVEKGVKAFESKRYADAAKYFESAFDANPVDVLLKNAMVAWYKAGNCKESMRVANRMVARVGVNNLSSKVGKEIDTITDCALDEAEEMLDKGRNRDAFALLSSVAATNPAPKQRNRNEKLRLLASEALERDGVVAGSGKGGNQVRKGKANPVYVTPANSGTVEETGFRAAVPFLSFGMMSIGVGASVAGGFLEAAHQKHSPVGIGLMVGGSILFVGGVSFMVYYFITKEDVPPVQTVFRIYTDPKPYEGDGIYAIGVDPIVSRDGAGASLQVVF